MKRVAITLLLLLAMPLPARAEEDAPTQAFAFVETYIRDIGEAEHLMAQARKELAEVGGYPLVAMIHSSTRMGIEFRSEASILRGMRLPLAPPLADIPTQFAQLLDQKADLHESMVEVAERMTSFQPGADYGQLAAEGAKLSARMEQTDAALFKGTPLIFAALIRGTPDAEGHMTRLVISKAERADLIRQIELEFGAQVDAPNQNSVVLSAAVLLAYLRNKGFKCTDEP